MTPKYTLRDWKVGLYVLLAGMAAVGIYASLTYETDAQRHARVFLEVSKEARQEVERAPELALRACQKAVRQVSRDPETVQVPDVGPMSGGADHRFLWNEKSRMVRMRNGLGSEVAVGAFCVVDEASGRIKLLTVDGKQIASSLGA